MRKIPLIFPLFFCICLRSQNASEILADYLRIPSLSGNEKKAALFIENICREKGLQIRNFSNSDSSYNFAASVFPLSDGRQNIILVSHCDVVAPGQTQDWKFHPFSGKLENDTIWGRGALDMKGMTVMQLMAILKARDTILKQNKINVTLLVLSGEETGGRNGAKIICDNYLEELKPSLVLGEGGGGIRNVIPGNPGKLIFFVSVAEKKSLWIKLEANYRSHAHASVPDSKNANKLILKAIGKVEDNDPKIKFDRTSKTTFRKLGKLVPGMKGFLLGHVNWFIFRPLRNKILSSNELFLPMVQNTFQLTRIENPPGSLNQIPSISSAYFDCRLLPRFNEKPFTIKRLMRVLDPRIKLTILDESPEAKPTRPDKYYSVLCSSLKEKWQDCEVIPFLFVASSDNSYFRSKGIPVYGLMPFELNAGLMQTVHGCNERIPVKGLEDGIELYANFIGKICREGK